MFISLYRYLFNLHDAFDSYKPGFRRFVLGSPSKNDVMARMAIDLPPEEKLKGIVT